VAMDRQVALGIALALLAGAGLAAQSLDLDAAVAASLSRSVTVIDARAAVEAARLRLELSAPWRTSRLTGKVNQLSERPGLRGETTAAARSLSISASAPLVTGLSLDATLEAGLDGSFEARSAGGGATLRPFACSDEAAEQALAKALVQVGESARLAALEARNAYRAAWLACLDLGIRRKALEAAEARAEAVSLNASAGVATQADAIDADTKRIDAMVALLDSTDRADRSLADLSRLVGRPLAAADLVEPDPGAGRAAQTKEAWLAARASLATLAIDLESARLEARPLLPDLALSGRIDQDLTATGAAPTWSLAASLTLDPDTFLRGKDRAASLDFERMRRRAAESRKDAAEEYEALAARIASTRSALEAATGIGTTARLSYEKNSYLAEAGTLSGASLLDSETALLSALYRVQKARCDLAAALDALDGGLGVQARTNLSAPGP